MVLRMRLARFGRTNEPFYNIVVTHARTARNSKPLEVIGTAQFADEATRQIGLIEPQYGPNGIKNKNSAAKALTQPLESPAATQ
ncbi:hypothetical protein BN1723_014403 [Verticillium longisporum]|uniref:Uncharacterized protein n=1 Tax=Verticillium longisporum TaxID=100787 RepID=A0A0G4M8L4_VERLO|nr:hypothetical protein BN1723_014403 [Verticillium longisporum]